MDTVALAVDIAAGWFLRFYVLARPAAAGGAFVLSAVLWQVTEFYGVMPPSFGYVALPRIAGGVLVAGLVVTIRHRRWVPVAAAAVQTAERAVALKSAPSSPFAWEAKEKVALILALAIGAALSVILGYILHALGGGGRPFDWWISEPFRFGAVWWGLFGAAVAAGLVYIRRLTSR